LGKAVGSDVAAAMPSYCGRGFSPIWLNFHRKSSITVKVHQADCLQIDNPRLSAGQCYCGNQYLSAAPMSQSSYFCVTEQ